MTKIPERNIFMGATEVTQLVYEKVMGKNPASHKGRQFPVESVSWYDAVEFCNTLSQMYNLKPAYFVDDKKNVAWDQEADGYRLPTEAEWEFCSKGGKDFKYSGSDDIDEVGWYNQKSNGTSKVIATKKANDYGLYDMTGNVWEWCWDFEFESEKEIVDKGGSFKNKDDLCSITTEDCSDKNSKYSNLGIRLVRGKISDIDIKAGEEITKRKKEKVEALLAHRLVMLKIPGKNVLTRRSAEFQRDNESEDGYFFKIDIKEYVGDFKMLKTEVTQDLYKIVMGENPSEHKGSDYPVENVSWYDAIYFCNKLSARRGLTPVYAVNGETDVSKWGYIPHKKDFLSSSVTQNTKANGYRLPTEEEFYCAERGGEEFKYAGSDNLNTKRNPQALPVVR